MKLSTKGQYGVVAMVDLAVYGQEDTVALKSISERQGISESYLEQLFAQLKKSGIVKSVRGSQGGYSLAERPERITIGSILRVLEGSMAPVGCVDELEAGRCVRYKDCITRFVWANIKNGINEVVDSITLKDLAEKYKRLCRNEGYIYYI